MPGRLPEIYRTLGTDYGERVLPSIIQVLESLLLNAEDEPTALSIGLLAYHACVAVFSFHRVVAADVVLHEPKARLFRLQETLKSVIAQYNASQLLTMREV